jgi:hypothetical protein
MEIVQVGFLIQVLQITCPVIKKHSLRLIAACRELSIFGMVLSRILWARGSIILKCKNDEHKVLTSIYLILRLTTNIVSLGQLEEDGHKIVLQFGFLKIWDRSGRLVAKVQWVVNHLYILQVNIGKPVCLTAQGDSPAWYWHARYGHLNFRGLWKLATGEMVNGLPWVD